ncbi:MAG: HEAT repeat domain-containing protein [Polyangiaceae bacterium]
MKRAILHPGLSSPDPEQRRQGVAKLAKAQDASTVAALLVALGDEDWRVRKEAISVALEVGPGIELLDALVATFSTSDNVGLRNAVTEALGGLGGSAVERIASESPFSIPMAESLPPRLWGERGILRQSSRCHAC